jgi:biopolymer transport protein ExbD
MTPIIDVVFLLIIFFLLVCQFIVAENFEVAVPAHIATAQPPETAPERTTTVTVMFDPAGKVAYAVGAEKIAPTDSTRIADAIADAIDKKLKNLPPDKRVVSLRNDKNITYRHTQHALAAISQSTATDIKWAVIK